MNLTTDGTGLLPDFLSEDRVLHDTSDAQN